MTTIKLCPFCGKHPILEYSDGKMRIACRYKTCPVNPVIKIWRPTKNGAISIWNRRVDSATSPCSSQAQVSDDYPKLPSFCRVCGEDEHPTPEQGAGTCFTSASDIGDLARRYYGAIRWQRAPGGHSSPGSPFIYISGK